MMTRLKPPPILYFAYGPTMNPGIMASICRAAKPVAPAVLPHHDLGFFGHCDTWDGGEKTLVRRADASVHGVVYRLSVSDLDRLDASQSVKLDGSGPYFHYPDEVIGLDGTRYDTLFYKRAMEGEPQAPSCDYIQQIIAGAEAHGLSAAYVARLKRIPSRPASYSVPLRRPAPAFASSCAC
ncbi:gamma-glutamylcyclotransferase family protein [Blastochloris sulfoviridis]|uniref:Gamma-glutamylcyclotransferase n=1 Tax=Blastochloris sulfoviridis TaxID=50712 RepID=A0A5M6I3A2_9HYPH|nr:gamma-glutamylcyclotransferase family protein [Blastochloris sulfoviridis]KAA5602684.1 gamma-glutamylcyclotransferase [Blastochloris sulfoviridis]